MQSRDTWANLAQAHLALARVWENILDFTHAGEEYEQAPALAPGNAEVLRVSSSNAAYMGHFEAALAAARRSVALDPLARTSHSALGRAVYLARHYEEAVSAFTEAISVVPDFNLSYGDRGLSFYGLGDLENARASCEIKLDFWYSQCCLAVGLRK